MSEIVIYEDGNVELPILFDKEVDKKSNMQKMHIANSDKLVKF